jgi:imidazolonepropionase-like amidohydrolase
MVWRRAGFDGGENQSGQVIPARQRNKQSGGWGGPSAKGASMVHKMIFLVMLVCSGLASAQVTVIHAGKMIDGQSDSVREAVTITIEGNRIRAIQDGYVDPAVKVNILDLKAYTVLPGLMDLHTHLTSVLSKDSYSEKFRMDPQDYAFRAAHYAEITLMAGFTTIREVGSRHWMDGHLKRAIARGYVVGPRIHGAGTSIATTGGHADPTNGVNHELMGDPGAREGVVDGVASARKAVRYRYKKGADWIKITATGGVLSVAKSGQNPQFKDDELRAIIETAADYGMPVAAHAHGTEGIKRAVRAGVRTIEHGTYLDDEAMALMIERQAYLVPTLMAGWYVTRKSEEGFFPDVVKRKVDLIGPVMKDTFAKAVKRGVPIAFGTDSGVSPHGDNAYEFVLMVEGGMSPMAAIKAATSVAAKVLEVEADLGTLAKGKLADIVAVPDNPLTDIHTMTKVAFVMKDGVVYKMP